jgi:hypothetical protein
VPGFTFPKMEAHQSPTHRIGTGPREYIKWRAARRRTWRDHTAFVECSRKGEGIMYRSPLTDIGQIVYIGQKINNSGWMA